MYSEITASASSTVPAYLRNMSGRARCTRRGPGTDKKLLCLPTMKSVRLLKLQNSYYTPKGPEARIIQRGLKG